jgi:hypothetical protein
LAQGYIEQLLVVANLHVGIAVKQGSQRVIVHETRGFITNAGLELG